MNDLAASIGIEQLKKLDKFKKKKIQLISHYNKMINFDYPLDTLLPFNKNCAYWLYGIRTKFRDELIAFLKKNNIECGVHFLPMSKQPFFTKYKNKLPISDRIWREIITLPLHYDMTKKDILYISNKINYYYSKLKNKNN
jgi:perosamine synthetase